MTFVKRLVNHILLMFFAWLGLSDHKWIIEGTFPSSTLYNFRLLSSVFILLGWWWVDNGESFKLFMFSDRDGRDGRDGRGDGKVDTMGKSCSLFLGRRAESWERAWEEQKPWLHLSQDSDDKDCISLRMVMIQDCIKDGYNYVDEKDQIEGSNSKW